MFRVLGIESEQGRSYLIQIETAGIHICEELGIFNDEKSVQCYDWN